MTKRLLTVLVLGVLGAAVFAQALPDQSTLTITSANADSQGTLVGSGTYQGGNLTLDLSSGFQGSGILTVTTRGGDTLIYAVTVGTHGSVTLDGSGKLLQNINPSIQNRGGSVDITQVDASKITPPTLPDHPSAPSHPAPNAHANANATQGAANATDGAGNAASAAANGMSHASGNAGQGSGNADQGSGNAASAAANGVTHAAGGASAGSSHTP